MNTYKRKHNTLSIKDKNEIIERLDRGENHRKLAVAYGIGRATIYDICRNRTKIQKFVSTADSGPGKRQTLKKAKNPEVEEALYMWFLQERRRNGSISGPILAAKAKYFYNQITKKDDFVASKGWLDRFKSRHGIRLTVTGEKNSNDISCVDEFKVKLLQKIKELKLSPSQVYIADESELCWRVLPSKAYVSNEDESVPARNMSQERVTFLPCANASGLHKLRLLVIGKSKKPRAFENIELPVHYFAQKSAWMTRDLFMKWFNEHFVPEVRSWLNDRNLPARALLLLGNAPGHPSEEELISDDKRIVAMFFPPNSTAILHPKEQNLIHCVKQLYKKSLLLTAFSKDQPLDKTLRQFNMKDMVFSLAQSWHLLPVFTIVSSWKNVWSNIAELVPTSPEKSTTDCQEFSTRKVLENVATETMISTEILQEWFDGLDEEKNAFKSLNDDEIIQEACSSIIDQDDEDIVSPPSVSPEDAIKSFELCLQWAEENECSSNEILFLRKMRDKALMSHSQNSK